MLKALKMAQEAFNAGEIPVGALVVVNDEIIALSRNRTEELHDPTAHAETLVMAEALKVIDEKWLNDAVIYSTLEPCPMCASAAVLYRVKRIVFGAYDSKWGACGSVYNIAGDGNLNHRIEVIGGVMERECGGIINAFFNSKRKLPPGL
ncbi:nucleoside deaminase [bacterium]|nr:nucleoside deaminase [bacterium]